jgi:YD repeat-containing protein
MKRALLAGSVIAILGSASSQATETTTFTYDDLGRLISSSNSGGPRNGNASQSQYDPAGNRSGVSVGQPLPGPNNAAVFSVTGPANANEGDTPVYTITKTGPATDTLTVNYATANGSATTPEDYAATSGTLSFRAWETVKTVLVPVAVNNFTEPAETYSFALSAPSAGSSIGTGSVTTTIAAHTVGPPNQPPVTTGEAAGNIGVCLSKQVNVTANDTDPEGNYPLVVLSVISSPLADAVVVPNSDIVITAFGTPGSGNVTYTVRDSLGATSTGVVTFTVVNGTGCSRVGGP